MHYVSAQFDRIRNIDSYLSQDVWRECNRCLTRVVTALDSERGIKLGALKTDDIAATAILQKSLPKIKEETKVEHCRCHSRTGRGLSYLCSTTPGGQDRMVAQRRRREVRDHGCR